ncbi:hypothetical protein [Streptomyces sp. ISL-11]|uniref:hypothetical protein n=1 Tax=Streptomyces sp. ISL-11 TaxID=2819174 RepID=UPI001BE83445|nr:hypothetical protein [Streptomyces sp. ISL-11]MBT2384737.1 hypothetical protein [Streptomyces sp. ISL-11]
MFWPMLAVALAFCGIAVLGVLAARVLVEVRRLAGQVSESSRRITRAAEDLERAATPLAAHAAHTSRQD